MTDPEPMDPQRLARLQGMDAGDLADLVAHVEWLRSIEKAESDRLRAALQSIASGHVAGPPALVFAERILAGDSIEDAHAAARESARG